MKFSLFLLLFLFSAPLLAASGPPYQRIISLYSAHTENLVHLGAEEQLIGISSSDDYPPHILTKPRFSYRQDPEKFIASGADLVLVRPMIERAYPQLLEKLRQAGITVISLQPKGVEEMYHYWETLAALTCREVAGRAMVAEFRDGLEKVAARVAAIPVSQRPQVYFESIHKKMKTFAPKSLGAFVLREAGGRNIAADARQVRQTNIAAYGKEHILSRSDEIDIYVAQQGRMNPVNREIILSEPGFQAIKAVQEGKVFLISESLVSRPTMRILEGIKQMHRFFFSNAEGAAQ